MSILITTAIAGCGLESSIYYAPPNFHVDGSGPIFLTHNTANIDGSFLGYDVYYRVYHDSDAAASDLSLGATLSDTNNYTPISALNKLVVMGFTRMHYLESENILNTNSPLLRVANVIQQSQYTVQVNVLPNWYYTVSDDGDTTKTPLVRNTSTPGSLASFNSQYSIGNADYADKTNVPEAHQTVYIVMFAVAYGFDINSTSSSSTILSFPIGVELTVILPSTYPISFP